MLTLAITATPALAALSSDDASFVQSAQQYALGDYALATLARSKAEEPTAKSLGAEIASNAAQANDFIRAFAKSHDVSLDNKPSVRADTQYGNISSDSGRAFDKDYANAVYTDTSIALSTYRDEAAHGSDPALRTFAKRQLSAMEQFSKTAQKLAPQ
jgi:predicted outer membrane protein